MIMTSVMSYQFWYYTSFTAGRLRFNIIIGHLLLCLHCFEGFMFGSTHCPLFMQKGLMAVPEVERLGMETVEEGNTLVQLGRGRQTFKRAYCCSFHSGFDCLCFDLVWAAMLCSVILL